MCKSVKAIQRKQTQEFENILMEKQIFYQNMQCVIVKNQDLSKNYRLAYYWAN